LQGQRVPSRILYGAIEAAIVALRRPMFSPRKGAKASAWAAVRRGTLGRRRHNQGLAGGIKRLRKLKADY
jgi:hypothetical protein